MRQITPHNLAPTLAKKIIGANGWAEHDGRGLVVWPHADADPVRIGPIREDVTPDLVRVVASDVAMARLRIVAPVTGPKRD